MVQLLHLCEKRGFFRCANAAGSRIRLREINRLPSRSGGMRENNIGRCHMRVKITMACSECKQRNYDTKKNKKNDPDRLEMKKYCRFCRKHTLHKESK